MWQEFVELDVYDDANISFYKSMAYMYAQLKT